MSAFVALLQALPEILALIKMLQDAAKNAETARTVKADLAQLHQAFQSQDVEALKKLMNK